MFGHDEKARKRLREWQKQHPLATDSELTAAEMILFRNLHAHLFTPYAETEEAQKHERTRHA